MIGPPSPQLATPTGGKWERSIKQWMAERLKSTEGESQRAIEYGQKFIGAVVSGIGRLFLVLMVAAFILVDLGRIQEFLRSLVPDQYQLDYDRIATGIDRGLSGVIRGQIVICAINGALTYLGLWLFHVKYPLLLAGIAAAMSFIPVFGSILSSVPIVVIALISSGTFDLRQGLFVLAWIIGIHQVEANLLNPKIMGDAAKIHPVLVVFALIGGRAQLRPGRRAVRRARRLDHPDHLLVLPAPPARAGRAHSADCGDVIAAFAQSGRSLGATSGPAMSAVRSSTSRHPGRETTSRSASITSARKLSCGIRRPLRPASFRAWQTGQSEIPSTAR